MIVEVYLHLVITYGTVATVTGPSQPLGSGGFGGEG